MSLEKRLKNWGANMFHTANLRITQNNYKWYLCGNRIVVNFVLQSTFILMDIWGIILRHCIIRDTIIHL
jgi:hypothetical protein